MMTEGNKFNHTEGEKLAQLTGRGTINHCTYEKKTNRENSKKQHVFAVVGMVPSFQHQAEQSVIFFSQLAKNKQNYLQMNSVREAILPEKQCGKSHLRGHVEQKAPFHGACAQQEENPDDDCCSEGRCRISGTCHPSDGISILRAIKTHIPLSLLFSASICVWTRSNPSLATHRKLSSDLSSSPLLYGIQFDFPSNTNYSTYEILL